MQTNKLRYAIGIIIAPSQVVVYLWRLYLDPGVVRAEVSVTDVGHTQSVAPQAVVHAASGVKLGLPHDVMYYLSLRTAEKTNNRKQNRLVLQLHVPVASVISSSLVWRNVRVFQTRLVCNANHTHMVLVQNRRFIKSLRLQPFWCISEERLGRGQEITFCVLIGQLIFSITLQFVIICDRTGSTEGNIVFFFSVHPLGTMKICWNISVWTKHNSWG